MNGRMYDPAVGRFLSADIVVQDPGNTQSYNRYSYCLNNPLKYTDPSGYILEMQDLPPDPDYSAGGEEFYRKFSGSSIGNGSGFNYGGWGSASVAINTLMDPNREFGGYWSRSTGLHYFKSEDEEQYFATVILDAYDYWKGTDPKNFSSANFAYNIVKTQKNLLATNVGKEPQKWLPKVGAFAIPISIADGPFLLGEIVVGSALTVAIIHDAYYNKLGNDHYPGDWSYDRGQAFIPPLNDFDPNNDYYKSGNTPPGWFWPAIGAAGIKDLYDNWPTPTQVNKPIPLKELSPAYNPNYKR